MKSNTESQPAHFQKAFEECVQKGMTPARVSFETKGAYNVIINGMEIQGLITGKLMYGVESRSSLPVVGDWVECLLLDETPPKAIIHSVIPRKSCIARKVAGSRMEEQPIAANVDTVFIAVGMDNNFNLPRISRYLALIFESGAKPVVLLNKSDLCADNYEKAESVRQIADNTEVITLSALTGQGIERLVSCLKLGDTAAFIGSSGVGKSTLINLLIGSEHLKTQETREDDSRGRHTTTNRQLIALPNGIYLIDTPGMREVGMWGSGEHLDDAFTDIEELSRRCRFTDCEHQHEPGCAVVQAIGDNQLDEARLEGWRKLRKELLHIKRKTDHNAVKAEQNKWKLITKHMRNHKGNY